MKRIVTKYDKEGKPSQVTEEFPILWESLLEPVAWLAIVWIICDVAKAIWGKLQ